MIILEGPDGSGKTTLAEELCQELDVPIMAKPVASNTLPVTDLQSYVDQALREGFHRAIFDRFSLISESIYGPVLRSGLYEPFNELSWLSHKFRQLKKIKPVIIWCLPPLEVVKDNSSAFRDTPHIWDEIPTIYFLYWTMMCQWYDEPGITERWVWDYTVPQADQFKQALVYWCDHELKRRAT